MKHPTLVNQGSDLPEPSDAELVSLAQAGDVNAVGELYDRHQSRIFRYVRARIFDNQTAQDVTGDVFLKMVSSLHSFRNGQAPFSAWLYRIAHNHVINHGQKQVRIRPAQELLVNDTATVRWDPAQIVESESQFDRLAEALEHLEETQREVLVLRFLSGLSLHDVAAALDKSVASVKAIQYRGLKSMRGLLKKVAHHEQQ